MYYVKMIMDACTSILNIRIQVFDYSISLMNCFAWFVIGSILLRIIFRVLE